MQVLEMIKTFLKKEDGQALTEMVIVMPIFLTIVLGIIQFSLIMKAKQLLNYASFCAARAGIVHNSSMIEMKKAAELALKPMIFTSALPIIEVEVLSSGGISSGNNSQNHFFPVYQSTFKNQQDLDASLLVVQVHLWYEMKVPYINRILSAMLSTSRSSFIKLSSTCRMRMQSDSQFQ